MTVPKSRKAAMFRTWSKFKGFQDGNMGESCSSRNGGSRGFRRANAPESSCPAARELARVAKHMAHQLVCTSGHVKSLPQLEVSKSPQ